MDAGRQCHRGSTGGNLYGQLYKMLAAPEGLVVKPGRMEVLSMLGDSVLSEALLFLGLISIVVIVFLMSQFL